MILTSEFLRDLKKTSPYLIIILMSLLSDRHRSPKVRLCLLLEDEISGGPFSFIIGSEITVGLKRKRSLSFITGSRRCRSRKKRKKEEVNNCETRNSLPPNKNTKNKGISTGNRKGCERTRDVWVTSFGGLLRETCWRCEATKEREREIKEGGDVCPGTKRGRDWGGVRNDE